MTVARRLAIALGLNLLLLVALVAYLERSVADADRAARLSGLVAFGALVLAILMAGLLTRSVTESRRRLSAGTREGAPVAQAFNTMAERLGAIDRLKQDFVSSVSHDLTSPLAAIRETTTLLLDGPPGPLTASQRRLLHVQRESVERLGAMIAKLLDLSRPESGLPLSIRPEPLTPLLEAAVACATTVGIERDVRVALHQAQAGIRLECDTDRIRQLLDNLLDNAVKFSPRGALVDLATRVTSDRLEMSVADRGSGVPAEDRERIFERFFQGSEGRAVRGRGVGLGLSICRQIVQAHGGTIRADERDGGGSIFRVSLPGINPVDGPVP